jgi:hypothetical protein
MGEYVLVTLLVIFKKKKYLGHVHDIQILGTVHHPRLIRIPFFLLAIQRWNWTPFLLMDC